MLGCSAVNVREHTQFYTHLVNHLSLQRKTGRTHHRPPCKRHKKQITSSQFIHLKTTYDNKSLYIEL